MVWIIYFLIGAALSAMTGYFYGRKLLERAHEARNKPMIPSNNDSAQNAKEIASIIRERAFILGNRKLSWDIKDHKGKYVETRLFKEIETEAFLKGECIKFIKFIRWCHFHGCGIVLRQIGEKVDVTEGKGEVVYLSMPDIESYK